MSLVVLATLAVAYTLWAAQDIILPVLLAMFFALVGNPILRLLQKLWIPRALGALLVLGAGLGVTSSLAVQLIGPAMEEGKGPAVAKVVSLGKLDAGGGHRVDVGHDDHPVATARLLRNACHDQGCD